MKIDEYANHCKFGYIRDMGNIKTILTTFVEKFVDTDVLYDEEKNTYSVTDGFVKVTFHKDTNEICIEKSMNDDFKISIDGNVVIEKFVTGHYAMLQNRELLNTAIKSEPFIRFRDMLYENYESQNKRILDSILEHSLDKNEKS